MKRPNWRELSNRIPQAIPSWIRTRRATAEPFAKGAGDYFKSAGKSARSAASGTLPSGLAFLSQERLLHWLRDITESTATVYDKAMDANYLDTGIGGGKHRLFDGGHDLTGAWSAIRDALPDDSLADEVAGYASAWWKDASTPAGMPFATLSQERYDDWAEGLAAAVPGFSKNWFSDLLTYDAFEILSASIGVAAAIYLLKGDDVGKLSELLGAMGIIGIISANPLLGIAAVLVTAHAYLVQKRKLQGKNVVAGSGMALISIGIFSILGLHVLVELAIVLIVSNLIRKKALDGDVLFIYLRGKIAAIPGRWRNAVEVRVPSFGPLRG